MRTLARWICHLYLGLSLLAGMPAGAQRSVICVAPNGHIAIEEGLGRCADHAPDSETSASVENAGASQTPDGCGDCVDMPVSSHVSNATHHGTSAASPEPPAATPAIAGHCDVTTLVCVSTPALSLQAPAHPAFPPSRTTILRN
jgi:hypothetical protein